MSYERIVTDLLKKAGITVNGCQPYDIKINNKDAYRRIFSEWSIGLGESYMDGWWDCERIDQFIARVLLSGLGEIKFDLKLFLAFVKTKLFNLQSHSRAKQVCEFHYDLDNELFIRMLDPRMVYTCGYWKYAGNLAEAQVAKMELICRKLGLRPGMRILDIGCGYGSFMKYAAEKYDVECVGYTLSREQIKLGEELSRGLPVKFVFEDFRNIKGKYDRIVSIGMFEAVGYKNNRVFMEVCAKAIKDDGYILLHTMGANTTTYINDPWFEKYIFPNGHVPSLAQIAAAAEKLLVIDDLHNFGQDYAKTLLAWNDNFQKAWPELKNRYPERFKRMWEYYLLILAGSFQARNAQLYQIVMSKTGVGHIKTRDLIMSLTMNA
jgi:cyclopropane-fatty-acyl-phospholipid synthase